MSCNTSISRSSFALLCHSRTATAVVPRSSNKNIGTHTRTHTHTHTHTGLTIYRRFLDNHFLRTDVFHPRRVTDVSQTITFPERRFPDKTFPGKTSTVRLRALIHRLFPIQDVSRTIISRTDVSRTICINNFEYFGMFMYGGLITPPHKLISTLISLRCLTAH